MIPSIVVYAGLLTAAIGFLSLLKPIRRLGVTSRRRAAMVFFSGAAGALIGAELPASVVASPTTSSALDSLLPRYQFNEVHSTDVRASPESTYSAIRKVTAREIRLFRILTWIRSPHLGSSRESILNPAKDDPIIDVATRTGFLMLADEPPREIAFGTVFGARLAVTHPTADDFRMLDRPGYAKIAMNFLVIPAADGSSHLRTETRIYATDGAALRRFAPYWRLIYPGSSIIRRMWLRAIRALAER